MRLLWLAPIACAAFLLRAPAVFAEPRPTVRPALPDELVTRIERFVGSQMARDRVPGVVVAIVEGDEVVYARGFGESCPSGPEASPQTQFVLGSMSKAFTGVAIMQLVEAGKVELDVPVRRYLEDFRVADEAASAQITVRQLLQHTSGISSRAPLAGDGASLAEHVQALSEAKLVARPGERHHYTSFNYQVLGLLVERVSGEPFGDYVQKHIFAPLGMASSRTTEPGEGHDAEMACGHRYWFGFPAATRLPFESGRLPSAALISSAQDMARFLGALLSGGKGAAGRVLSPAGTKALFEEGAKADGFSYAMGWRVGLVAGVPAATHGGHLYHFRGKMALLPEKQQGVVVLTNASSMIGPPTSHLIANGIVSLLADKPAGRPGLALKWKMLGIALLLALFTFELLKEALALRKWKSHFAAQRAAGRRERLKAWLLMGWGLVAPVALLMGLPLALHLSWFQLFRAMPDVCGWLLIYSPLLFLVGLVRLRLTLLVLRSAGASSASVTTEPGAAL